MKRLKQFIVFSFILSSLFFLFGPKMILENFQPQEILDKVGDTDIIIVFNSGGWGNTPLQEAKDFEPVIKGIGKTLEDLGYSSIVVPFNRTKDGLLGKITGARDFLSSFSFSSNVLAKDLESLAKNFPDKKIIIAGLSNGATFVTKTYEKISDDVKNSIYAITAGSPFWAEQSKEENVLQLDNNGKDNLAVGNIKALLSSLIKVSFNTPEHQYNWNSPEVGPPIVAFLEDKFH